MGKTDSISDEVWDVLVAAQELKGRCLRQFRDSRPAVTIGLDVVVNQLRVVYESIERSTPLPERSKDP